VELRPYQREMIRRCYSAWNDDLYRRILAVMPTGSGKTVCFAHIAHIESQHGRRVLILAHRDELIDQAAAKLILATGTPCAVERGTSSALDSSAPVVVASVQTLHAARLQRWRADTFDLVIVDEAHHALADSYQRILEHFATARVLGVTATPDRGDRRELSSFFEAVAYEYPLREAIQDGWLCPITAKLLPLQIDLRRVRSVAGDYHTGDLDTAIAPVLAAAVDGIAEHSEGRKTLVFLPLIRTSEAFVHLCRARGLTAEHIDGESVDRRDMLRRFAAGEFQILSNSNLLLEGYDCPDIACVVCLRPTRSRPLYVQMIGRGTRIAPGKRDLLILDFLWQTSRHSLCVPASLIARDDREARDVMARIAPGRPPVDLIAADRDAQRERERTLARQLQQQRARESRVVDPLEFALSIADTDLAEYTPVFAWERQPPSDKQLALLSRFGVDRSKVLCRGHASALIDRLLTRRKLNLCTLRQACLLRRHGIDPSNISFTRAREIIDDIMRRRGDENIG